MVGTVTRFHLGQHHTTLPLVIFLWHNTPLYKEKSIDTVREYNGVLNIQQLSSIPSRAAQTQVSELPRLTCGLCLMVHAINGGHRPYTMEAYHHSLLWKQLPKPQVGESGSVLCHLHTDTQTQTLETSTVVINAERTYNNCQPPQ